MKTQTIETKETENTKLSLVKSTIKNISVFSVITYSKKHTLETGREIFDTLRKGLNYYNKY